jgi:hypothetical protein
MQWTTQRFPRVEGQIRDLVRQHRVIPDEPLHLAMTYEPGRDSPDVFLFELLGNFGGNDIGEEQQLFEVAFGPSLSLALEPGQDLHLVLTNPAEFPVALEQHWPTAEEIRDAVRRGDFEVLHSDETGQNAFSLLHE